MLTFTFSNILMKGRTRSRAFNKGMPSEGMSAQISVLSSAATLGKARLQEAWNTAVVIFKGNDSLQFLSSLSMMI